MKNRNSGKGQGPKRGQSRGPSQSPSRGAPGADRASKSFSRGGKPGHGPGRSLPSRSHGQGHGHGPRPVRRDQPRPNSRDRWVIGVHSCEETLKVRPHTIRELWLREDYDDHQPLRAIAELAAAHGLAIKSRTPGQLDALGSGHQGVALATTESPEIDWAALAEPVGDGVKIVLILDGIEDPHNLGSMLRTSWLTGVAGILIPEDRAVGITPTVCKVASGGAEHVAVESFTNLPSALQQLKDAGFWVYGLSEKGTRKPWDFKLPEKVAWVIGSEGSGMRITTERACDELVRIPQVTGGSSYNAAVAAGMALMETCRQFGKPE